MFPVVYVNCDVFPFISWIISGLKVYETRNRNTLKRFIGQTVYLAETHKGKRPVVRCTAFIESVIVIDSLKAYNKYRPLTRVKKGSLYDFQPGKVKYLYKLANVQPVAEFIPEGKRHGMTWLELES